MLRTVLEETGLYSSDGESGRFASPQDLTDPGLHAAWTIVAEFFQSPGRKFLADIVSTLSAPPIGLPAGVLPLLVVSGFKAFGRAASLRVDGAYPNDVLGFDASRMFLEPQRVEVEVHPSDDDTRRYLSELAYVFCHRRPGPMDEAVRFAADALSAWRRSLSDGVRRSRRHTDDGRKLLSLLADIDDPPRLILSALPEAFGNLHKGGRFVSTLHVAEKARADVDRLLEGYTREAVEVVADVLSLRRSDDPVAGVQTWIRCFDVPSLLRREDLTMIDKAVLRTALDTTNGRYTAESLARAVSSVLLQRGVDRWEDGTASQMRKVLRECRARIEDAALADPEPGGDLEEVINARIEALQAQLRKIKENVAPVRLAAWGTR